MGVEAFPEIVPDSLLQTEFRLDTSNFAPSWRRPVMTVNLSTVQFTPVMQEVMSLTPA